MTVCRRKRVDRIHRRGAVLRTKKRTGRSPARTKCGRISSVRRRIADAAFLRQESPTTNPTTMRTHWRAPLNLGYLTVFCFDINALIRRRRARGAGCRRRSHSSHHEHQHRVGGDQPAGDDEPGKSSKFRHGVSPWRTFARSCWFRVGRSRWPISWICKNRARSWNRAVSRL